MINTNADRETRTVATMTQDQFIASETDLVLDHCIACGKCVEICPMWPHSGAKDVPADEVTRGIVSLLRSAEPSEAATAFLSACSGSARCRDICPEGLDPVKMMRVAKVHQNVLEGQKTPKSDYKLMDLSRQLQLGPTEPRWFTRRPPADARAELVFYMGCNVMRTPHIALTVMDLLDRLGVDYATVGGGANCCGIKQFRVGLAAAETVARNTIDNFATLQPKEVVSWCPTCEVHFTDFGANYVEHEFPINHLSKFLLSRLADLRPLFQPLPLRVVLEGHAPLHPGDSVNDDITTILSAIPGLDVVPTEQHVYGYQCNALSVQSAIDAALDQVISETRRVEADTLVSVYHGCHRHLVKAAIDRGEPFEVVNWVSLIARALGQEREDRYRAYAQLGEENLILEEALALDWGQGIPLEGLRQAIAWEFGSGAGAAKPW
jgi:Fe-S oxidoreductase